MHVKDCEETWQGGRRKLELSMYTSCFSWERMGVCQGGKGERAVSHGSGWVCVRKVNGSAHVCQSGWMNAETARCSWQLVTGTGKQVEVPWNLKAGAQRTVETCALFLRSFFNDKEEAAQQ